jgi:hypothetical protein
MTQGLRFMQCRPSLHRRVQLNAARCIRVGYEWDGWIHIVVTCLEIAPDGMAFSRKDSVVMFLEFEALQTWNFRSSDYPLKRI